MKLTITSLTLRKELLRLSVVPGVQTTNLATQAIQIEADDFSVRFRRTTTHASVAIDLEADIEDTGTCGVDFALFNSAVLAMPGEETTIESDGKLLTIRSGRTKAELNLFPVHELLPAPEDLTSNAIDFAASDLIKAIKITSPAAATASHEPKFSGLCLRVQQDRLTLFGVDRKRVHVAYIGEGRPPLNPNGKSDNGHMIVNESIAALQRILSDEDCRVTLSFSNGNLHVTTSDTMAILPLSEDQPPAMDTVLPTRQAYPIQFTCNRTNLLRAVRTAAPLGFQDQRVLSLKIHQLGVEIIADTQHGAKLGHEVSAVVQGDGGHHLRVNAHYLADFINAIEAKPPSGDEVSDDITLHFLKERNMLCAFNDGAMAIIMLIRDDANTTA